MVTLPVQNTYFLFFEHNDNLKITFLWPQGVSCDPPDSAGVTDSFSPTTQTFEAPPSDSRLQQSLVLAKRNVYELRRQLSQLRHLQVLTCVLTKWMQNALYTNV